MPKTIHFPISMSEIFASCPFDDCVECRYRCVLARDASSQCGAYVDITGTTLEACAYCAQKTMVATQDETSFQLDELLGHVWSPEDVTEEVEAICKEIVEEMLAPDQPEYTTIPCVMRKRLRCEEESMTFSYFQPFKRPLLISEREGFLEFLDMIF